MRKTALVLVMLVTFALALAGPATAGLAKRREHWQHRRMERGIRSGRITPREAARLDRQQGKIERDRQKAMADGHMSRREHHKINREQNRAGRTLFRKKHNRRHVHRRHRH